MKKLFLLCIVASLLVVSACKKDSEPTKKELLTGKNWKLTAYTVDPSFPIVDDLGNIIYTNDFYAQMSDCDTDDLTKYNTDGTAIYDEGPSKCDPAYIQTTPGTWVFSADESVITINFNDSPASYTILELTSSTLKMKIIESFGGTNYTEIQTYTKK